MRLFNAVQRTAIPAMAWRAAKLFQGMILQHVRIGMARVGRVVALPQTEIGFRYRHGDWNDQRIRAQVAGLTAIDESSAAKIIEGGAGGVHVDLPQLDIEIFHAAGECGQVACRQSRKMFFYVGVEIVLRFFFRLIDLAALGHEPGF